MSGCGVVYLGGRQAGCIGLLALLGSQCRVLSVVAYDTPVRRLAEELHLHTVGSIHEASLRRTLRQADLLVSVHGREVVPPGLLALPRHGGINVHPCLYAYKGKDPITRLLRDRNPRASVGVHRMTARVDEGEVLVEEFLDITGRQSEEEVYNALYPLYAIVLVKALRRVQEATAPLGSIR